MSVRPTLVDHCEAFLFAIANGWRPPTGTAPPSDEDMSRPTIPAPPPWDEATRPDIHLK